MERIVWTLAVLGCVLLCPGVRAQSGDPSEAAYKATMEAYIRFLPRYYAVETMDRFTAVDTPNQVPQAPVNQIGYRDYRTDSEVTWIVRANVDTVLAAGFIDLSDGPLLLKVPQVKNRYWRVQLTDLWTEVADTRLSSLAGSPPGVYAIVGPGFTGEVPNVKGTIRAAEDLNFLMIQVGYKQMRKEGPTGPDESGALHTLREFTLAPMGQEPAKKAKKSAKVRPVDRSLHVATAELAQHEPLRLLDKIRSAVKREGTPMTEEDLAVLRAFEEQLDVAISDADASLANQRRSSAMIEALGAARQQIDHRMRRAADGDNGWVTLKTGNWGDRYLDRAAGAEYALFSDRYADVMFMEAHVDEHGEPLVASRRYYMEIPNDMLPTVDGFWSLASYREDTLTPGKNAIERGSIGDMAYRLQTKKGKTILYIQHQRPDQGKVISWLPAPEGSFNLVMRAYGPRGPLLDGTYKLPPIKRGRVRADSPMDP